MADKMSRAPLIDNLNAPEVFGSEVVGFSLGSGNVTLTIASMRAAWSETGQAENRRIVIGRLVLPIAAAQGLSIGLYDFLKGHGLDPAAKPEGAPVQ